MKLKYEFETVELDGEIMAVPVGDNAEELHAMLRLNDTASAILKLLAEETTEEAVCKAILAEYEGDETEIRGYIHEFIGKLKEFDLLA